MELLFEWDDDKERINIKKHGMDFSYAAKVFEDDSRIEYIDERHSSASELRYITIGLVDDVICVVYTERINALRVISARRASNEEKRLYYGYR